MPANLPAEWYALNEKIKEAKSLEEKIELLKKLISITPKHKGTENLLADLRKRLAKLRKLSEKKKKRIGRKPLIEKVGDILVSIIGLTNSGKSLLLKKLTNASVEISERPFSTITPKTGVCFYKGVRIQFVEIPSFFTSEHLSIAHNSDILIILIRKLSELNEIKNKIGKLYETKKKIIVFNGNENFENFLSFNLITQQNFTKLLNKILDESGIIRVFTKPPGKKVEEKALILKKGSKVRDAILKINKSFLENFKFAKIYDNSKFSPKKVGLDYELKDGDILEIHVK